MSVAQASQQPRRRRRTAPADPRRREGGVAEEWRALADRGLKQVLAALSARSHPRNCETSSPCSRGRSPTAKKPWGGQVPVGPRVLTTLSAAGHVARIERRVVQLPAPLGVHEVLARGGADATSGSRGRGETGRAVAARAFGPVRRPTSSGGSARPSGPCARRWPISTPSRWISRTDRIPAARRRRDHRSGRALGGASPRCSPTTMGWFERDWYLGFAQRAVVRHQR